MIYFIKMKYFLLYLKNNQEKTKRCDTEISIDKILQKLYLEEYNIFPPKNDSFILNMNTATKEKEKEEQLLETEYVQNLNKLNYLIFSPFGNDFLPSINNYKKEYQEKE